MKGIVSLIEIRPALAQTQLRLPPRLEPTLTAYTDCLHCLVLGSLGEPRQPRFEGEVKNVTVKLGQEAVLSCSVTTRGDFKVGWIKVSHVMVSIRRILVVVVVMVVL